MRDRARAWRDVLRARAAQIALTCGCVALSVPAAHAGTLDLSLSSHYSTGDYGGKDATDIVYVPLELRYETGLWEFKALVPYLRISGGSAVVETPNGPVTTRSGTSEGVGDLLFEVRRSFEPLAELAPWITIGTRVKAPTADEHDGLGTGAWDVTPGLELAQRYGRWTPFVTAGYRFLGNSGTASYRNGFVVSVGSLCRVFDRTDAGLFFDWKQQATGNTDASLELLPMLRVQLARDWMIDAYVSTGFTDAAPDVGTGMEIVYRLFDSL